MAMSTPVGPYTPVVRAGDWLAVSGQVGLRDGSIVNGGLRAELTQALTNMRELIESEGGRIDQVVKTTVYLLHMRDYPLMNEAYVEFFGDHRPARSAVAVVELPIYALIEVDAWAYLGD
jgi:2-iminobutanoate/2-iminopropanoate deaminase